MTDSFAQLREDPDFGQSAASQAPAEGERGDLDRRLAEEKLGQAKQDRGERKTYAKRIFWVTVIWLAVVAVILVLQGFGGGSGWFSLPSSVLIATATTTTASVTAILVVVARYLFPS